MLFLRLTALAVLFAGLVAFALRYRKHLRKKAARYRRETWAIGMYEGPTPFDLSPSPHITNPVLTGESVTDIKARFVADPFMIEGQDGKTYLFFEVLNTRRDTGEIGYAWSDDRSHWHYGNIIIRSPHHLSYPYVFFAEGQYHMLPECHGSKGIQLYRAKRFPDRWERVATIIRPGRNTAAVIDPSIFQHEGIWYLFSYGRNRSLHLFSSRTLSGPWKEHPKSPIITDTPHYSRPAGRVIDYDGAVYRFAQDEVPHYGTKVWAFRITSLSETQYAEEAHSSTPVIQPGTSAWNQDGMHHIDAHRQPSGKWVAFVDGFTIKQPNS